ncbi:hypothetical protein Slin15195_G130380 [Septoria linicola]|uniref:Uncharacterized protein n=1 Tax=Septoria linicola TaxID=215465 RepID=A0A9Q9B2G2_9PEZI|nr:hypothetical protein Slin15195_G130380 [Septoria linicola]
MPKYGICIGYEEHWSALEPANITVDTTDDQTYPQKPLNEGDRRLIELDEVISSDDESPGGKASK